MASNETQKQQSTTELKYLGILNTITVRFVVIMSNVYDFAKESYVEFKSTFGSAENNTVSTEGQKLKQLAEETIVFADDKFDEYASSSVKEFVDKAQSIIYKFKPLVKLLVIATQILITPLISITIFFLQITKIIIKNLKNTTTTTTTTSAPQATTAQNPLQSSLATATSLVPDLATQAQDTTKSLLGGIPLLGNAAPSLVPNPTSLLTNNPLLGAVSSAAQTATNLANQAQDAATSVVGNIPIVGDAAQAAQSLVPNPADLANQIANATGSLVTDNPLLGAVNSVVDNIGQGSQATGLKAALQSAYLTLTLALVPVIAQLWYELVNQYPLVGDISEFILPVVEAVCKLYNKVVTYLDGKGYGFFGYLPTVPIDEMEAAYKLVKTTRDGLSAVGGALGVDKGLSAVGNVLGVS